MLTAERAHTLVSSIVVFALTTFFAGAFFLFLTPASSERMLLDHIDSVSHVQGLWLLLDGNIVSGQPELPFGVMIDNRPEGRPQSGLSEARVVYETLVEGGTTRLMAVFQNSDTLQIGPVRSARPYFIPLVRELDAAYVHSGGSPGALAMIEDSDVHNVEEISYVGTKYFWRDTNVPGPYNLFTSSPGLRGAAEYLDYATSTTLSRVWHFAPVVLENEMGQQDQRVLIDWSVGVEYDVAYEYNSATARYERWIADRPHIDRTTSRQLTVANIVVQRVPAEQVLDDIGRLAIDVEGAGAAIIFRHGKAVHGSWRKQHAVARTLFFDESGREIDFVPGTIWVEIVPGGRKVSIE